MGKSNGCLNSFAITTSRGAASKKRIPVAKTGGIECRAISIANQVVPQIRHTDKNSSIVKDLEFMAATIDWVNMILVFITRLMCHILEAYL
ncbi:hypothetical protein VSA01S_12720 [Vibrio sagamiensis NBRC 104589]|uniref:Uncharacterized protein n=1 Tax=Vibrio sagamiensis NBRC 104589 TaxID=1219064 RepID=A0A511QCY4_9VIBR|nr:hypothetical protein VSA01S_12720 [Vibrio sagamiensis NBRC 104589]